MLLKRGGLCICLCAGGLGEWRGGRRPGKDVCEGGLVGWLVPSAVF